MTVNEIVSYIRGLLKEHDDSYGVYVDKFLWETFLIAKAEVYSNLRLRRFNFKNPQNEVGFCIELEQGLSHECGCVTYGCKVLTTKYELPRYFSGRNTGSLKIYTLGNKEIEIVEENEFEEVYKYNDMYKNKILASIINNKIVIWNTLDLKLIRVKAYWEDITQIDDIQFCSDSSSDPNCIDVYSLDIGVDKDLLKSIVDVMIDILSKPLRMIEDQTNDSNPEIKY